MREIKFRAWGPNTEHMWSWEELQPCDVYVLFGCGEKIVMQYTGLKDKNGKEIYEGDIVQEAGTVAPVSWDSARARFVYRTDTLTAGLYGLMCTVIGNIYENPELLEGD